MKEKTDEAVAVVFILVITANGRMKWFQRLFEVISI
jgi:hypothetical protein